MNSTNAMLLLVAVLLCACGGEDFETNHWPPTGAGPEAAAGDSAGDGAGEETSVDAAPDAAPDAPDGNPDGSDAGEETSVDAGPEAAPDAPAGDSAGSDPEPDAAPDAAPDAPAPDAEPEACVPVECADVNQNCGLLEDGCGNTVDCGQYQRGDDNLCSSGSLQYNWFCPPKSQSVPPPFTGCIQEGSWPGSYCCEQDG